MFLKENSPEKTKKSKRTKKMEMEVKCPLCCEPLDIDELNFKPCSCGYQICLFCYNKLKGGDSKCPLCRRIYSDLPTKYESASIETLQKMKIKKKQEEAKKKQKLAEDRKQLEDVRVVRKNLIFINDLPLHFNKDTKLYQKFVNIFKQAGQIKKAAVLNSSRNYAGQKAPFARAYITYHKNEEALRALKLLDNVEFEGRSLKICLGTTKYCSNFIKNVKCTNKECVYLHEQAEAEASFTKEQIHLGKHIEYGHKLYSQYIQSLNNMQTKSIANQITEEKKSDPPIQTEELKKETITENSTSASTSQQIVLQNQEEKSLSPTVSEDIKSIMRLKELRVTNRRLFPQKIPQSVYRRLSIEEIEALEAIISSTEKGANIIGETPPFEERFSTKRESEITNGNLLNEENSSDLIEDSLLTHLNKPSALKHTLKNSFRNEIGSHSQLNNVLQDSPDFNLDFRDECGLDFDPVNTALGGLDALVDFEKQKARIEVNSLNSTPVNAFKKLSHQQSRIPQPIFSPSNNILQPNAYQNRSQGSPAVDYYNQSPYNRATVQSSTRSSIHSQSNQRFANTPLTIQLPRFSPAMSVSNSMVNGYSPQQFMSQSSPQDPFMLPQQQSQNFENYSQQHFSNFDQVIPSQPQPAQVFSVNSLQNQSVRDPNTLREYFGANLSVNQRLRGEPIVRQQPFQQQSYQPPQLQRYASFCNSAPQGGWRVVNNWNSLPTSPVQLKKFNQ